MSKVIFETYKDVMLFSKNLALAIKSTSVIHKDGNLWWLDDPRLEWGSVSNPETAIQAECSLCKKPVDFKLFIDQRARKEFKISGMCQNCQDGPTHCYNCKEHLDGSIHKHCSRCRRIICPHCGSCKCAFLYGYYRASKFYEHEFERKEVTREPMSSGHDLINSFKESIDSPTLVLVDMAFLSSEFRYYRDFYADLYSGNDPEYPAKSLPTKIADSALVDALCKYIWVNKKKSTFLVFQQPSAKDVLDGKHEHMIKRIRCNEPTYFEMSNIIASVPAINRVVIMADDRGYISLIKMLLDRGYNIGLIKHKQENDTDWSRMPPELAYQFSYYVLGESMGLKAHEI